jgi:GPH family glycoside/pentoside/hexuronide:cation symporter
MKTIDSFKEKLGLKDYVTFGIGDMAINFTFASLGMYVVYFYTDVVGIAAGVIGTLMLFSRSFDGVIDVVVGSLVDRTNTRWGKTRPWLLFGCVPLALLTTLLFAVPRDASETMKIIYVFLSYNLLMIAFSCIAIPYGTLNSLVTQDQTQREKFNLARMFLAQIGVLIVTNLTTPMVNAFGGTQTSWVWTYLVLSLIGMALLLVVFKTQRERVVQPIKEKVPLKLSLKALAQNKYWFLAFGFFVIWSVMYALTQGSLVYYAKYILGDAGYVGVLSLAYLIPAMVMLLICGKLYEKYGKTLVIIVASVVSVIGYALPLISPENYGFIIFTQIVKGIGYGPMLGAVWALFPDTIEYGYSKTGVRNEGLLYSGGSLGQKIGVGVGTALVGWVLAWGGYQGTAATQSASAISSIYQIYIWIPIILLVVGVVILFFYDIDKHYKEIMEGVARRNEEHAKAAQAAK